jgi:hypothetical protein
MEDKKVIIRINLDTLPMRLLILGLLAVLLAGLVGSVAWAGEAASPAEGGRYAPLAQGVAGRQYYLTPSGSYDGSEATSACAEGYHMASIWELLDLSNLTYNTTLGSQKADMGEGPPTHADGWVRTGNDASTTGEGGQANCSGYTSATGKGTVAWLPSDWESPGSTIGPWRVGDEDCDDARVWCVED